MRFPGLEKKISSYLRITYCQILKIYLIERTAKNFDSNVTGGGWLYFHATLSTLQIYICERPRLMRIKTYCELYFQMKLNYFCPCSRARPEASEGIMIQIERLALITFSI